MADPVPVDDAEVDAEDPERLEREVGQAGHEGGESEAAAPAFAARVGGGAGGFEERGGHGSSLSAGRGPVLRPPDDPCPPHGGHGSSAPVRG